MAIPCYFNDSAQKLNSANWIIGHYGSNAYFFFTIWVVTTILWALTLNFHTRRSVGLYMIFLYALHHVYIMLAEFGIIHGFGADWEHSLS